MASSNPQTESAGESARLEGLLAEFRHPGDLLDAAESTREAGYRRFDTYSPFPVHGMDEAMGLGQSKVGYIVFAGGITGAFLGWWLQWWTGAVDYPLNISGKPFFALWPSVPIIFELTVLLAALGAVGGMLALNGLPRLHNPLFNVDAFEGVTDDRFFLQIEADDPAFEEAETEEFLQELGALRVDRVEDEEPETSLSLPSV